MSTMGVLIRIRSHNWKSAITANESPRSCRETFYGPCRDPTLMQKMIHTDSVHLVFALEFVHCINIY